MIASLMETGWLEPHIRQTLCTAYAERYHLLMGAIQEHLEPLGITAPVSSPVAGGYFIWISLPAPLSAVEVVKRAQTDENLRLAPGTLFQVAGGSDAASDRFQENIRLCFAWEEPRHLTEGVRRLARVVERMR